MFLRLFQRVAYAQAGEAMVVAICRGELAAAFDGDCGEKGIGYQVPFDLGGFAETAKNLPVTWARIDESAIGLVAQFVGEGQGFRHAAGRIEHVRMGDDPEKATEDQIGYAISMVGVDQLFKPGEIPSVVE